MDTLEQFDKINSEVAWHPFGRLIIYPDGNYKKASDLENLPIEKWQEAVEGYIEIVDIKFAGKKAQLVVNDEGMIKELKVNLLASYILSISDKLIRSQDLYGNVILAWGNRRLL